MTLPDTARSIRRLTILIGGMGLTFAVVGPFQPARAGTTHAIQVVDFAFAPAGLTVTVGDTVTWTNMDAVAHTATSTTGAFDSGTLDQGESFSLTVTSAGTFDYLCTPHPSMTGRIIVEPAQAPAPTAAPPSGGGIPNVAMAVPRAHGAVSSLIGVALVLIALLAARVTRHGSHAP
jgi:plastocyanin